MIMIAEEQLVARLTVEIEKYMRLNGIDHFCDGACVEPLDLAKGCIISWSFSPFHLQLRLPTKLTQWNSSTEL